jgi:hypothetical protein
MRYVKDYPVGSGDHPAVGIWDTDLDRGRLVWINGRAYDLIRPRDDHMIETIIAEGEASEFHLPAIEARVKAEFKPQAQETKGQLTLF